MYRIAPLNLERYQEDAIAIYEASFPLAERRPTAQWMDTLKYGCHCSDGADSARDCSVKSYPTLTYMIEQDHRLAGFFVVWSMHNFYYGEHFAISSDMRNHGLGGILLDYIIKECGDLPFVIEIEPPQESPMAQRRCAFYQKHGMHLIEKEYLQPPYRSTDGWLPLKLMSTEKEYTETHFKEISQQIHRIVYGITNEAE